MLPVSQSQFKILFDRLLAATLGVALLVCAAGCAFIQGNQEGKAGLPTQLGDRAAREQHGYVYYLDGAGGGTGLSSES